MNTQKAFRPSAQGTMPVLAVYGSFSQELRDKMVREQAERVEREAPHEIGDRRKGNQRSGGLQQEKVDGTLVLVYVRWKRWYWRLPTDEWKRSKRIGVGPFPTREAALADVRAKIAGSVD